MRHPIDPKVDCVFKALLGAEANRALLIHFLNAILGDALSAPIRDVLIANPYNEREFSDDKLSIVDVKATDESGQVYQIEVQLLAHRDLPARILYGWADSYSAQLQSGERYGVLRPTYSIWLLGETLLADEPDYKHCYRMRNERGRVFVDHGGIWLLELSKFTAETVETEQQRWLKFFKEAETLNEAALPPWMQTPEMRQAMSTLKQFSEKELAYHAYQARQNYLRVQASYQADMDEKDEKAKLFEARAERATAEAERASAEAERATAEAERANAEAERERAARTAAEADRAKVQAERDAANAELERLRRLLDQKPGQ